jgi:tetratricopeptide (TPR) repeat protein
VTARQHNAAFIASLVAMLAVAVGLQVFRDRAFAHAGVEQELLYVRNAEVMRRAALSYDTLLADVYWIRALQHYGGERQKPGYARRYELLYPLLDLTTTLDPRFSIAYRFGAIFLAEPRPGGAERPDLAIALLEKGVVFDPAHWDYYHDIGFIYYWHLGDYKQAAEWFGRGGNLPGAPFWLKTYSAIMLTRGGDRQASRALWTQIGQSKESDWLRRTSQIRLAQLDALDQIEVLHRILDDFTKRAGRHPQSWEQLAAAGAIRGVPLDPSGTPYTLDGETGAIGIDEKSELWPLPTEPVAAPELKLNRGVPRMPQ